MFVRRVDVPLVQREELPDPCPERIRGFFFWWPGRACDSHEHSAIGESGVRIEDLLVNRSIPFAEPYRVSDYRLPTFHGLQADTVSIAEHEPCLRDRDHLSVTEISMAVLVIASSFRTLIEVEFLVRWHNWNPQI